MKTKTMNHLPSRLVLALVLVPSTSGCGGGKNDDGADGSSTTGDDGYTGPCESTELWEWAMWGRLERGAYGENAVVECRCSLDCAADQLCVGFREENPAWEPGAEEDVVPIFVETRCKARTPTVVEPRYTDLRLETHTVCPRISLTRSGFRNGPEVG